MKYTALSNQELAYFLNPCVDVLTKNQYQNNSIITGKTLQEVLKQRQVHIPLTICVHLSVLFAVQVAHLQLLTAFADTGTVPPVHDYLRALPKVEPVTCLDGKPVDEIFRSVFLEVHKLFQDSLIAFPTTPVKAKKALANAETYMKALTTFTEIAYMRDKSRIGEIVHSEFESDIELTPAQFEKLYRLLQHKEELS